MLIVKEGIAATTGLPDITRGEAQTDPLFCHCGRVDGVMDPPSPVIIPEMMIRIGRIKPEGE